MFGFVIMLGFAIWVMVQCTGGGSDKTGGLNTETVTVTYLVQDYETFKRGQEVLATGDI